LEGIALTKAKEKGNKEVDGRAMEKGFKGAKADKGVKVEDTVTRGIQKEWVKAGSNSNNRAKEESRGTQGMGKDKGKRPSMGSATIATGKEDATLQEIARGRSRRTH
jgi:hypothetical protein